MTYSLQYKQLTKYPNTGAKMVAESGAMAMMIPVANRDEPLLRAYSRKNKIMTSVA